MAHLLLFCCLLPIDVGNWAVLLVQLHECVDKACSPASFSNIEASQLIPTEDHSTDIDYDTSELC